LETDAAQTDASAGHPFRDAATRRLLPAEYLDVSLSNFVIDAQGLLHYIDAEWQAPGPIDADLVAGRALWSFAVDLVHRGVLHPWPPSTTVDEMAERLGGLGETRADAALLARWKTAESDLQSKIHGRPPAEVRAELDAAGQASRLTASVSRHLPFTLLRRQARELQARLSVCEEALRVHRESTSWKLTAPIRWLGRLLSGRG
jgi:hypothetical protein